MMFSFDSSIHWSFRKKRAASCEDLHFPSKICTDISTRCWGCFQGVINFTTRIIYKSIKWWYTTSADLNSQEDIFASCRSTGSIPEETLHQQWPEVFNTVQARFEMNFANLEKHCKNVKRQTLRRAWHVDLLIIARFNRFYFRFVGRFWIWMVGLQCASEASTKALQRVMVSSCHLGWSVRARRLRWSDSRGRNRPPILWFSKTLCRRLFCFMLSIAWKHWRCRSM